MDTEEVLRNKGYKSISDADIELGEQKAKLEAAEAFLRDGDPVDRVARVLKLPLETVQSIADRIAKPA